MKEDSGEEGRGEGKKKQSPSSPSEEEKMFKLTVSTADPAPACPPPCLRVCADAGEDDDRAACVCMRVCECDSVCLKGTVPGRCVRPPFSAAAAAVSCGPHGSSALLTSSV